MNHKQEQPNSLLSKLRRAPEQQLLEHIKATEGLTDDEIGRHKKFVDYVKAVHWNNCKEVVATLFSWSVSGLIVLAAILIGLLVARYVYNLWDNEADIKELLRELKEWVLISLSVLFIEEKIQKKKERD